MNNLKNSPDLDLRDLTVQEIELGMWFLEHSTLQTPIPKQLKKLKENQWVGLQVLLEDLMQEKAMSKIH